MFDPNRFEAISCLSRIINFVEKFIPDLISIASPLYDVRINNKWCGNLSQAEAFNKLKAIISKPPILALYDSSKETLLSVDASSYNLGCVLMQLDEDANNFKPVAFASRTLSKTEKSYAQIEKKAVAVAYGYENFSNYIIGKLYSSKQTINHLCRSLDSLTSRLQRVRLRLLSFMLPIYCQGIQLKRKEIKNWQKKSQHTTSSNQIFSFYRPAPNWNH